MEQILPTEISEAPETLKRSGKASHSCKIFPEFFYQPRPTIFKGCNFHIVTDQDIEIIVKKSLRLKTKCHLESYDKLRLVHNLNSRPDPPSSGFNIRVAVISYPNLPRPREREISLFSRVRSGYEIRVAEQFRMRRKS